LLQHGYLLSCDALGQTPLYCACRQGHKEIVLALLNIVWLAFWCIETSFFFPFSFRSILNLQPSVEYEKASRDQGSTPLHIAGYSGHADAVALLLMRGMQRERLRFWFWNGIGFFFFRFQFLHLD
jgi:hypothetical protein